MHYHFHSGSVVLVFSFFLSIWKTFLKMFLKEWLPGIPVMGFNDFSFAFRQFTPDLVHGISSGRLPGAPNLRSGLHPDTPTLSSGRVTLLFFVQTISTTLWNVTSNKSTVTWKDGVKITRYRDGGQASIRNGGKLRFKWGGGKFELKNGE